MPSLDHRDRASTAIVDMARTLAVLSSLLCAACALTGGGSRSALGVRGGGEGEGARAVFAVESAYTAAKAEAASGMARWRRDVDEGRLCPKGWSDEASGLFTATLKAFDASTRAFWQAAARAESRRALAGYLASEIEAAHRDQLSSAAERRLRQLRAALGKSYAASGSAAGFEAELAKVEHAFDADATRCAVPALELGAERAKAAFLNEARGVVRDFEASPAGQLIATRGERARATKAAKTAQKQAAKASARGAPPSLVPKSMNVAFQLVGMLRPRGFGNMQGFCSYALGPHSLLFGFADDRDPAGDMGGDDALPLLRLQPKFTVDLDM